MTNLCKKTVREGGSQPIQNKAQKQTKSTEKQKREDKKDADQQQAKQQKKADPPPPPAEPAPPAPSKKIPVKKDNKITKPKKVFDLTKESDRFDKRRKEEGCH